MESELQRMLLVWLWKDLLGWRIRVAVVAAGSVGVAGLVAATLFVCYSKQM